jgi:Uma2 family endonuclease
MAGQARPGGGTLNAAMPVAVGVEIPAPPPLPPRKRWTRQEIALLEGAGAMEGQHFELVEGDLINKMGKHMRHMLATKRAVRAMARIVGWDRVIWETSISVAPRDYPTSNPEPDVIVLHNDAAQVAGDEPAAEEIALLMEISDTTLKFDLSTKAALYARAGIADYWVLDLTGGRLLVHRQPVDGLYQSVLVYSPEESAAPLAGPGESISVAELLG